MRRHVLVCYDISDQKRWSKVYKTMKGNGEHVQYSVFICQLTGLQEAKLKAKLDEVIHHNEDQVMFVDIGTVGNKQLDKKISTIGRDYMPRDLTRLIY